MTFAWLVLSLSLTSQVPADAPRETASAPVTTETRTAPPLLPSAPARSSRAAACGWTAAAVGTAAAIPTMIGFWFGGLAKGLFAYQFFSDTMPRLEQTTGLERPAWVTPQTSEAIMIGMALAGALFFSLSMPGWGLLITGVLAWTIEQTDAFGTGVCREGGPVRRAGLESLLLTPVLFALALPFVPVAAAPVAVGFVLILTSLRILPRVPLIPALGFSDRQFAVKRAGLMTTAIYPAYWVIANLVALGVMNAVLWSWTQAAPSTASAVE
ncbi:MAG: hypothetical protein AB2A00_40045 [Myxococcota bacterium]